MGRDVKEILVGMVVVVALFLAIGLSYGGGELTAPGGFELHASFNRVDGLAEGDEVRMAGIRVGSVERQTLDDKYRAVVTFRLDSDLRLPTDTSVAIHTDGLFGAEFAILDQFADATLLIYQEGHILSGSWLKKLLQDEREHVFEFELVLQECIEAGLLREVNLRLTANLIKSMIDAWVLKRWDLRGYASPVEAQKEILFKHLFGQ